MPIYEFKCECGHGIEVILPLMDRNKPQYCPKCGGKIERILSVPQPPVMAQYGGDMALKSLNSKEGAFPNRYYSKAAASKAAAGL